MDPNITHSPKYPPTPWGARLKFKIPAEAKPQVPLTSETKSEVVNRVANEIFKEPRSTSSGDPIQTSVRDDDILSIRPEIVDKSVNQSGLSQLPNTRVSDLLAATRDKDDADVREFLSRFNVYGFDANGRTPLTCAVVEGNHRMLRLLTKFQADFNRFDATGWTPLTYAIAMDNREMVTLLKELGSNVNGINGHGMTPLTFAVAQGNREMVKVLVKDFGAKINKIDGSGGTPLTSAVAQGNRDMVELLVNDLGADVNAIDGEGVSPLTLSIELGNSQMVALLKTLRAEENLEILECKFLAHAWGMKGTFEYQRRETDKPATISYEGLWARHSVKKLAEYARAFLDDPKRSWVLDGGKEGILNAIEHGYPLSEESPEEMAARVQRGEPVVITNGLSDHAISMVLCKGQLAVCNRGLRVGVNSIEFYDLPCEDVTPEILLKLMTKYPDIQSFNAMLAGLGLSPSGGYHQKDQKVGNCSWASPKAAFGALCHLYFGEKMGRKLYKEFTAYTREPSLEAYLQNYQKSTSYDTNLVESIVKKRETKSTRTVRDIDFGRTAEAA